MFEISDTFKVDEFRSSFDYSSKIFNSLVPNDKQIALSEA